MSQKWRKNGFRGNFNGITIYLIKSWDLAHGIGWFVYVSNNNIVGSIGYGFHKNNKFTAVREALKDLRNHERNLYKIYGDLIYSNIKK